MVYFMVHFMAHFMVHFMAYFMVHFASIIYEHSGEPAVDELAPGLCLSYNLFAPSDPLLLLNMLMQMNNKPW